MTMQQSTGIELKCINFLMYLLLSLKLYVITFHISGGICAMSLKQTVAPIVTKIFNSVIWAYCFVQFLCNVLPLILYTSA